MKNSLIIFAALGSVIQGLDNGIGRTPQMGWNSWNKFGCNINEEVIKNATDRIVSLGLGKLGYKYVNLDDCWNTVDRTTDGHQ